MGGRRDREGWLTHTLWCGGMGWELESGVPYRKKKNSVSSGIIRIFQKPRIKNAECFHQEEAPNRYISPNLTVS